MLCAVASILTACGYNTYYVDLKYPPEKRLEQKDADVTLLVSGSRSQSVRLVIVDKRELTGRLGTSFEDFGPNGSVLTDGNVAVWTHDAIASELQRLGFALIDKEDSATSDTTEDLAVEIIEIKCLVGALDDCRVSLRATLIPHDQRSVTGDFVGKAGAGWKFARNEEKTAEALARALQRSISMMLYGFGFSNGAGPGSGTAD
jgi:hypothetical protein